MPPGILQCVIMPVRATGAIVAAQQPSAAVSRHQQLHLLYAQQAIDELSAHVLLICERRGLDHDTLHWETAGREKLFDLTMEGTQPQVVHNRLWLGMQIDDVLGHAALLSTRGDFTIDFTNVN